MLIDTHCHLNDERFNEDREEVISSLFQNGIEKVVTVGFDPKSSIEAVELADCFGNVYASVGTHPHDSDKFSKNDNELYQKLSQNKKVVAIGEIGLDYFYDLSPRDVQKKIFVEQLYLANSIKMPVIIHLRDAYEDMEKLLSDNKHYVQNGLLFHCYSGSMEMAKRYFKFDPYFSFGGSITFKNAKNPYEVLPIIPKDRIVFETDSPYLTPVPFRGKRNEPKFTIYAVKKASEILGIDEECLINQSTLNALTFFKKMN